MLKIFKKTIDIPYPEWEEIVEIMYDKSLEALDKEIVKVIYSKDKSMRYVITKDERGLYQYCLQAIHQFDYDTWKYICSNDKALPAMWEPYPDENKSFFDTFESALKEIKEEIYYTQYFSL